jgi:large subunit ribosomal protein L15
LPKRGFRRTAFQYDYKIVNLGRLQEALEAGKLKPDQPVDGAALVSAGVLRRAGDGIRLLAKGELKVPLTLEVAGASKAAVEAVEKLGGKVVVKAAAAKAQPAKEPAAKA